MPRRQKATDAEPAKPVESWSDLKEPLDEVSKKLDEAEEAKKKLAEVKALADEKAAQAAYETYYSKLGNTPNWNRLEDRFKNAWRAVAKVFA